MSAEETSVEFVSTSDSHWQRKCQRYMRDAKAFKLVNIETEEQRSQIVALALQFGATIAHADGAAYVTHPQNAVQKRPETVVKTKLFLVVEDNANDAILIRRVFDSIHFCHAFVCRNLGEAQAYLGGAGVYSNRNKYPMPNGIICDLILGKESGITLIKWLKASGFPEMPVYILTGTDSPRELAAAKQSGATDLLRKPSRFEELRAMLVELAGTLCA